PRPSQQEFQLLSGWPWSSERERKSEKRSAETQPPKRDLRWREHGERSDEVPDGENLTAEQLDIASVEMLQNYTDIGLRCFAEQSRHWQAMAEIELERRKEHRE